MRRPAGAAVPGGPNPPTVAAAYTWGAAGLVSERLPSSSKSLWYHFGPQGETRQLTNSLGTVVDTYTYSAYGVPLASTGSDANPFRYGGQVGYYTHSDVGSGGLVLCGARWYQAVEGRWLTRDPIGYGGGPNLYEYCGGDPVGYADDSGTERGRGMCRYIFSVSYTHDIGQVFAGEFDTVKIVLNPKEWVKGAKAIYGEVSRDGWQGVKSVAASFWEGAQFWNKKDPRSAGASAMSDILILAPLLKKVPNPTPIKLRGPYGRLGSCTVVAVDNTRLTPVHRFRLDVGHLPTTASIPRLLRGKVVPHWHRRATGGIGRHRPWQAGPGGRRGRL